MIQRFYPHLALSLLWALSLSSPSLSQVSQKEVQDQNAWQDFLHGSPKKVDQLKLLSGVSHKTAQPAKRAEDMDAWQRFSHKGSPATDEQKQLSEPQSKPSAQTQNESGNSYVLIPAAAPTQAPPQEHEETTIVPHPRPGGFVGLGGPGFFGSPFGGGFGGLGVGFGMGGFGWGGFGMCGPGVGYETRTKVIQTGPSLPSGNYFSPPAADPRASGNYYQDSTALPKAAPIIHQDKGPSDYWGPGHNPLPSSMQSSGGDH